MPDVPSPEPPVPPLLEARGVSVSFGGVDALRDVSLSVARAEAVGLVGPNGAGKTTLFECCGGRLRADRGSVLFDGRPLGRMPVHRRARLGIARTYQRLELFPEMTVAEHLLVAQEAHRAPVALWRDLLGLSRPGSAQFAKIDAVAEMVGLSELLDSPVSALSLGHCRLVELGRALATDPRLVLCDEPSSGLDAQETALVADVLSRVRDRGTAVLLVEHDLDLVARVVTRAVVLDSGRVIASGPLADVMHDPAVRLAYLGVDA